MLLPAESEGTVQTEIFVSSCRRYKTDDLPCGEIRTEFDRQTEVKIRLPFLLPKRKKQCDDLSKEPL